MEKIVGLKELRHNMEKYIRTAKRGNSLIVVRRSRPLFRITPLEEEWEEVIDFTKIKRGGIRAKELLSRL